MRYRVTHVTEYGYAEFVPLCHNVFRLRPRSTTRQICHDSSLHISPSPADRLDRLDAFGNLVTYVAILEPHKKLRIESVSEVDVLASPSHLASEEAMAGSCPEAWEDSVALLASGARPDLHAAREFTFDSTYVHRDAEFARYAAPSFTPGRPLTEALMDLTRRMFDEFTFDPRATSVGTPISQVLSERRGVCQDFAHLQIACCRSMGLAARYVSGYVRTIPPKGQKRLVGADASHAWVSVFIPPSPERDTAGGPLASGTWIDFDPTNGLLVSTDHVTLATGRDYDDIAPVRGVLTGPSRHTLRFGVDVEPLDPDPPGPCSTVIDSDDASPGAGET
jgi:transglutaminase-like putative cysteine protease